MAVDRPRMTREERAKQFLPFSAVRGLEEALEKKRAAISMPEQKQKRIFLKHSPAKARQETSIPSLQK